MKELLNKFDGIMAGVKNNSLYSHNFCDERFSEEIAITYNSEKFPVLRACPDMIQKLDLALDIAQDWLRSDKVYLEEIEKQVEQTKETIKENQEEFYLIKLEYNKIFSTLKQRQSDCEYSEYADETIVEMKNTLSRLEMSKYKLHMEILAVTKLLVTCRESLRMRGLRSTASPEPTEAETRGKDEVDGCYQDRVGLASSKYSHRVNTDARIYSNKLREMKQRMQILQSKIRMKNEVIQDMESTNTEVEQLSRKLKTVAKRKAQRIEELHILNDHLRQLEKLLAKRKYPTQKLRTKSMDDEYDPDPINSFSESNLPGKDGTLSADLRKAFRIVKNSIGHAWKDLARTLPYTPHKGLAEINNDIRAIEHENPGHLNEQAYQCLIKWYNHNGSHASLRDLNETLREINENRLADKLQGYNPHGFRQSCEASPGANDSGIE